MRDALRMLTRWGLTWLALSGFMLGISIYLETYDLLSQTFLGLALVTGLFFVGDYLIGFIRPIEVERDVPEDADN
jgi:hypothetical protein